MLNVYTHHNEKLPEDKKGEQLPVEKTLTGDFLKYRDPTNELPSADLRAGIWYARHAVRLHKLLVAGLVIFSLITWGYSLGRGIEYAIFGYAQDQKLMADLSRPLNYGWVVESFSPAPLKILSVLILPGGAKRNDAVAEIFNENKNFRAEFDYYFVIEGEQQIGGRAFILPGETKLAGTLGLKNVEGAYAVELVIENIKWQRVSPHTIADPIAWQDERLDFSLNNFKVTGPAMVEGAPVNILTFDVINNSPYGYKAPKFLVGLYQGGALVGVMPLGLGSLASLETKNVDLRSFVADLRVEEARLFPLINIYDKEAYLPLPVK